MASGGAQRARLARPYPPASSPPTQLILPIHHLQAEYFLNKYSSQFGSVAVVAYWAGFERLGEIRRGLHQWRWGEFPRLKKYSNKSIFVLRP